MQAMRVQSLKKNSDKNLRINKIAGVKSITDFKFDKDLRHSLPFPELKSRLVSAEILKGYGFQKEVVKIVLVLNRASHAFIISQEGLPGLLLKTYASMEHLLFTELNLEVPIYCTVNDHSEN